MSAGHGPSKRDLADVVCELARHERHGRREGDGVWVCVFCGAAREEHPVTCRPREDHRDGCLWTEAARLASALKGAST